MILQANIGGYQGRPASVIGFLDLSGQTLFIQKVANLNENRFPNAGLITNLPTPDFDYFFSEADFAQAFQAYRFYHNSARLQFDAGALRATPQIQVDKITENGTTLAIYGEISNGQMGVIALCGFAQMVTQTEQALSLYDDEEYWVTI